MEVTMHFNIPMLMVIAIVELISLLWYNRRSFWTRNAGDRFIITAIVCDTGLLGLLNVLLDFHHVRHQDILQMIFLSAVLALLFFCLEAPHIVRNVDSLSWCFIHSLHKFCIILILLVYLAYFK